MFSADVAFLLFHAIRLPIQSENMVIVEEMFLNYMTLFQYNKGDKTKTFESQFLLRLNWGHKCKPNVNITSDRYVSL